MEYKICPICGVRVKGAVGLAAHRRHRHARFKGKNRLAVEETIATLERAGVIEDKHAARLQLVRSLADQIDFDPSNAQMWKTYNDALEGLVTLNDSSGDAFETLIAEINSRAAVGDQAKAGA